MVTDVTYSSTRKIQQRKRGLIASPLKPLLGGNSYALHSECYVRFLPATESLAVPELGGASASVYIFPRMA